jgi:hypothetical protein
MVRGDDAEHLTVARSAGRRTWTRTDAASDTFARRAGIRTRRLRDVFHEDAACGARSFVRGRASHPRRERFEVPSNPWLAISAKVPSLAHQPHLPAVAPVTAMARGDDILQQRISSSSARTSRVLRPCRRRR